MAGKFEVYQDNASKFRWSLKAETERSSHQARHTNPSRPQLRAPKRSNARRLALPSSRSTNPSRELGALVVSRCAGRQGVPRRRGRSRAYREELESRRLPDEDLTYVTAAIVPVVKQIAGLVGSEDATSSGPIETFAGEFHSPQECRLLTS